MDTIICRGAKKTAGESSGRSVSRKNRPGRAQLIRWAIKSVRGALNWLGEHKKVPGEHSNASGGYKNGRGRVSSFGEA
jgi:hypothetical protein